MKHYTKEEIISKILAAKESPYRIDKNNIILLSECLPSTLESLAYPAPEEDVIQAMGTSYFNELFGDKEEPQDIVTSTILERGKVYGDPFLSHKNIGKTWTALLNQHYGIELEHDVPASLVAQMMVSFKMQRSAKVYKDDNYIDAHAYTKFADEFQKKEQDVNRI